MTNRYALPHPCFRCGEVVKPGEQVQYYANLPDPLHHACFLRPIIGSVAHLERRCSCYVPGAEEGDDPRLTRRQAAEAALALFERLDREAEMNALAKRCQWPSITCPKCGRTSYNVNDIEQGYCGQCHAWTADRSAAP